MKKTFHITAWLVFLLLGSWTVHSAFAHCPAKFEHLTTRDGLSMDRVMGTAMDKKGFLWFATHDGLNRYDGRSFLHLKHDPDNSKTLSHNVLNAIAADHQGMIWVGSVDGLNRFDPRTKTVTRYLHDPKDPASLSGNFIQAIFEDSKDRLWILTAFEGLNRFDEAEGRHARGHRQPEP